MVYTSSPPLSSNGLGQELVKSMWSEFAIVTLVLATRFYTRIRLVNRVGWDDAVITLSYIVNLVAFIFNNLAVNNGFGLHTKDLSPELVTNVIKWAFLGQIFGIMASAITRMAFIITLIILLAPGQKIQLWILRAFFVVQIAINSTISLYILLQCRPTRGLWDHSIGAKCLPPSIQEHIGFSQGSINSFTDLALSIFPATIIWKLKMKTSIKISLCVTMGLGIFAFATAIMKTVKLTEISADPLDLTYIMFGLQFWFCIENCTLIICATIPTLRPLFTNRKSGGNTTYSYNPNGQRSYRNWKGTWNDTQAPAGTRSSPSRMSDQIELAPSVKVGQNGIKSSTSEYTVDIESSQTGADNEEMPKGGIRKTVDAYITY